LYRNKSFRKNSTSNQIKKNIENIRNRIKSNFNIFYDEDTFIQQNHCSSIEEIMKEFNTPTKEVDEE